MEKFNQLAKKKKQKQNKSLSSIKTEVAIKFLNPFMPTRRSERPLPTIHSHQKDGLNVTSQPFTLADRTFRTSIPQCQIWKDQCEGVLYYYAG